MKLKTITFKCAAIFLVTKANIFIAKTRELKRFNIERDLNL